MTAHPVFTSPMKSPTSLIALLLLASGSGVSAITVQEMTQRHKPLPTVASPRSYAFAV